MDLTDTPVLALGTTGAQGSGLVEALLARGARPVRVTTDPAKAAAWSADGQDASVGDLAAPGSLAAAAAATGARAAVMHVPISLGSPDGAVASVAALREAGLAVAVNVGGPVPSDGAADPTGRRALVDALTATGATVVSPTGYLENHAAPWASGAIAAGELLYPRPADDVIAWIAARDVTAAAVATLATDWTGELVRLAGPQRLTFTALASELAAGTGREVVFREVAPEEYGRMLEPYVGPQAAAGVAGYYGSMSRSPDPSLAPDVGDVWDVLGVGPTTARAWAAEVLAPALAAPRR